MTKRVMVVYGTRPEAIKMAPLVAALEATDGIEPVVVVTGQHREMLDQVNRLFEIVPEHDLDVMVAGASLAELAAAALAGLGRVLDAVRPDAVVVQGDTATAFTGALAAFYAQVPVVHLEAGLRSGDLTSPFPEEGNRVLLSRITDLHLAPTPVAARNLLDEGADPGSVVVTGNTVIDALRVAVAQPVRFTDPRVQHVVSSSRRLVLVTAHRRESWGAPMREAMSAVREVARTHPDTSWLVPMHRNPTVRAEVQATLDGVENVVLTEPLDYHEFCHAMNASHLLLTDSGGVQEEGPGLGKPVLVMRSTTERPEGVTAGVVRLVGTDSTVIRAALDELLDDADAYQKMARAISPFGDGRAAERAAAAVAALFGLGERLPDFRPV
ncbi:MAG: non-hydrolyzing UDP-N-acetylglucosamine 2-epimerase [Marmoricola sp.]